MESSDKKEVGALEGTLPSVKPLLYFSCEQEYAVLRSKGWILNAHHKENAFC